MTRWHKGFSVSGPESSVDMDIVAMVLYIALCVWLGATGEPVANIIATARSRQL